MGKWNKIKWNCIVQCQRSSERKSTFLINEWMNKWLLCFVPSWWFKCIASSNQIKSVNLPKSALNQSAYNALHCIPFPSRSQYFFASFMHYKSYVFLCLCYCVRHVKSKFKSAHTINYRSILWGFGWSRILETRNTYMHTVSFARHSPSVILKQHPSNCTKDFSFTEMICWLSHW